MFPEKTKWDDIEICGFTVEDLVRDPNVFHGYEDPYGYLPEKDRPSMLAGNPYSRPDDLALVLAMRGKRVIGELHLFAAPAVYAGGEKRTFWIDGFHMEEGGRKSGAGAVMMLRAVRRCKSLLASGRPNADAQRMWKAVGMRELAYFERYMYYYRANDIAGRYTKNKMLRFCLAGALTPALKLYGGMRRRPPRASVIFKPVEQFDREIDDLPAPAESNYFPKPAKLLNWILRFRKVWAFEIRRGSELLGYCLLKQCVHQYAGEQIAVGYLQDLHLIESDPAVESAVLSFAIGFFKKQKADRFECQIRANPRMEEICRRYGMIHRPDGRRVYFKPQPDCALDSAAPWHLTSGTAGVLIMKSDVRGDEEQGEAWAQQAEAG